MKIVVKRIDPYKSVTFDAGACIDTGLLDAQECEALARELIDAAYMLGPLGGIECDEWFARIAEESGIELPHGN